MTSIEALHLKAAKLPRVNFEFPYRFIGKTTEESIQSGVFWGTVFMIEGLIEKIKQELGENSRVIATGGLADKIIQHTSCIEKIDPYLSLEGMRLIYLRNKPA
jgi:type III pantothenate kinase